ncbi:TPA: hypothetical protein ACU9T0_006480 [Burkholderia cenocepacia]
MSQDIKRIAGLLPFKQEGRLSVFPVRWRERFLTVLDLGLTIDERRRRIGVKLPDEIQSAVEKPGHVHSVPRFGMLDVAPGALPDTGRNCTYAV